MAGPGPYEPSPYWAQPSRRWAQPPPAPKPYPPGRTPANYGHRGAAQLIDIGIVLAIPYGITTLAFPNGTIGDRGPLFWPLFAATVTLFTALFVHFAGGRTPGKVAAGLRTVRLSGEPVRFLYSLWRDVFCKLIFFIPCGLGVLVDWIWPTVDSQGQALHDKIASTFVVDEPYPRRTLVSIVLAVLLVGVGVGCYVAFAVTLEETPRRPR